MSINYEEFNSLLLSETQFVATMLVNSGMCVTVSNFSQITDEILSIDVCASIGSKKKTMALNISSTNLKYFRFYAVNQIISLYSEILVEIRRDAINSIGEIVFQN